MTAGAFYLTQDTRSLAIASLIATLTAPPIALLRLLYRYYFPLDEPIVWIDTSTRPDLDRLRPESPSELHVFCTIFYDQKLREVLLRVDIRPGHHIFVLNFPLFPSWQETPMLRLISSHGKLWIAPGPPPLPEKNEFLCEKTLRIAEQSGILEGERATQGNRTLTCPSQDFAGEAGTATWVGEWPK